ncbi:MAG: hypothetical protein GYA86_10455 [Firmicutes bacterium]|nr:hypothetical protein [Bacillota bacterium]
MVGGSKNSKDITEKVMLILGAAIIMVALFLGHWLYALGVALAASLAWLLYRWQMIAVINHDGVSPRKATARLLTRSLIRMLILFTLLGLSILGGEVFLFGVLTGLLLQVMTYMGRAFFIILRKGGTA